MALWKDKPEDDGVVHASEAALRPVADAVVSDAVRAVRRAFSEGNVERQWHAQALLELARQLRTDLQSGAWGLLDPGERRRLRQALLKLRLLAQAHVTIPFA